VVAKSLVGRTFTYNHGEGLGFGEHHAGKPLIAEMRDMDLPSGAKVTLFAIDEDSKDPVIQWEDSTGQGRLTTVGEDFFNHFFVAV
jgi:hypothetical protein